MDQDEHQAMADEPRREAVRVATGILIERYEVDPDVAESTLMDWSRITGVGVDGLVLGRIDLSPTSA